MFITCRDSFLSRDFILAPYSVHLAIQVFGRSASILIEKSYLSTDYVVKPQVFPQPSRRLPLVGKTAAHRGRGRRIGPSSRQRAGEELHQKWKHFES